MRDVLQKFVDSRRPTGGAHSSPASQSGAMAAALEQYLSHWLQIHSHFQWAGSSPEILVEKHCLRLASTPRVNTSRRQQVPQVPQVVGKRNLCVFVGTDVDRTCSILEVAKPQCLFDLLQLCLLCRHELAG